MKAATALSTSSTLLSPVNGVDATGHDVVRNRAKFCMFLAPEIFLGCALQNFGPAL